MKPKTVELGEKHKIKKKKNVIVGKTNPKSCTFAIVSLFPWFSKSNMSWESKVIMICLISGLNKLQAYLEDIQQDDENSIHRLIIEVASFYY